MPSHKFWRASLMQAPTPDTLELSEFQLFDGATRVDSSATLTSSSAPNSGSLANLKDDSTGTGAYWSTGGASVWLRWEFAAKQAVDRIVLGSRTTSSRYPTSLILMGGDILPGDSAPTYSTYYGFGGLKFVSATKSAALLPAGCTFVGARVCSDFDHLTPGGIGRVPYDVKREILPATTPKTYTPQYAKVRLVRDIDGKVIREEWSDPATGAGAFERVDENFTYSVVAVYPTADFRAVIADRLQPEGHPT